MAMTAGAIRAWRAVHTWTSLLCTGFLLVACITGLPIIFREELDQAFTKAPPFPRLPSVAATANLDRIVAYARRAYPHDFVRDVFLDDDAPQVNVFLARNQDGPLRRPHSMLFDARNGALRTDQLVEGAQAPNVLSVLVNIHASLFAGLLGEIFMGLMALTFVVALISGTVLYAPFMRKLDFGTVRRSGSPRLKWLDLHNLLGVATLVWALTVGATGVMNAFSTPLFGIWQLTDVVRLLKPFEKMPAITSTASLKASTEAALAAVPGTEVSYVTFPAHFQSSPRHYVVWLKGVRTLTSRMMTPVLVDAENAHVAAVAPMPLYLRALEISRPLHFGDYGGFALKILWALLDLVTIMVLGSGLYLWITKRRAKKGAASAKGRDVEPSMLALHENLS